MFNANQNGIMLRMFSVMVRNSISFNSKTNEKYREEDLEGYEKLLKTLNIQDGHEIEYFSPPPKEYPVLGYVGKSTVSLSQSTIASPGGGQKLLYNENDYIMIPDNLGYIRLVLVQDIAIASYEVPGTVRSFKYPHGVLQETDIVDKNEDSKVKDPK